MATTPMRRCVVCRTSFPQSQLVRIHRDASAHLVAHKPGLAKKVNGGRSAYVCYEHSCLEGLIAKPSLVSQSLKAPMSIDDAETLTIQLQTFCAQLNSTDEV